MIVEYGNGRVYLVGIGSLFFRLDESQSSVIPGSYRSGFFSVKIECCRADRIQRPGICISPMLSLFRVKCIVDNGRLLVHSIIYALQHMIHPAKLLCAQVHGAFRMIRKATAALEMVKRDQNNGAAVSLIPHQLTMTATLQLSCDLMLADSACFEHFQCTGREGRQAIVGL